jgi:CheY-like chemotaxis protein/two-component sensor histidine kinase
MIDDLLDVSRITRGKIELKLQSLDVLSVIEQAVDTVRPLIEARQHKLTMTHSVASLRVLADPHRLEQVIVNLLTNAAKYMDVGGSISITTLREGDFVTIRVWDRGNGMPPEKIAEMFELFAQGDRSIARSEGGLGIGLTIVKSLVELHGGSVVARSEGLGRGSEFTIRLPVVHSGKPVSHSLPPEWSPQADGHSRILVVDDNKDTATGLARLLRLLGHETATAFDGPAAIEAAHRHQPEYILLDIGLPGMDGYEVAQRLRAEGFTSATIIAISGYGEDAARRRSREAGFDHHLVKPIKPDELTAILQLERHE